MLGFTTKEWGMVLLGGPLLIIVFFFKDFPLDYWVPFMSFFPDWVSSWSLMDHLNFFGPTILIGAGIGFIILIFSKVI